ncbi:MAG: hypothetical protein JSR76_04300 [Verrucomicrobia bacterium]|nr:hypothetical protein [Verrucomicrobiota bacterium]
MAAFIDTIFVDNVQETGRKERKKMDAASAVLLSQLTELMPSTGGVQDKGVSGKGSVRTDFLESVVTRLSSLTRESREELLDAMGPSLVSYAQSSDKARAKVAETLLSIMDKEIFHPSHVAYLGKLLMPLMGDLGESLTTLQNEVKERLAKIVDPSNGANLGKLLDEMASYKLTNTDIEEATLLVCTGSKEAASKLSEKFPGLKASFDKYVTDTDDDTDQTPYTMIEGMLMMVVAQVQCAVTKGQTKQDEAQMSISKMLIQNATTAQANIAADIKAAQAAQEAAEHTPWWKYLIEAVAAVIGAVIAAVTGGAAAVVVAIAVTAFMASPAFSKIVSAIGDKIASDLKPQFVQEYIKQGYSKEEAESLADQKANAIGHIIGSVVATVVVAVLTLGLGAATSAADAVGEVGAEGAEVGEAAAEGAGAVAKTGSKLGAALAQGAKIATFNSVMALISTNIIKDFMMLDPVWAKKHKDLVTGLDIAATVLATILCIGLGKALLPTGAGGGLLAKLGQVLPGGAAKFFATYGQKILAYSSYIFLFDTFVQAGSQAYKGVTEIQSGLNYLKASSALADLATWQGTLSIATTGINTNEAAMRKSDQMISQITKGLAASMKTLSDSSGRTFAAADRALS